MNTLYKNKDLIFSIKDNIDKITENKLFKQNTNEKFDISIVMTSSNRSKQTYFTLSTFNPIDCKLQVILVDDSTHDPIDLEKLKEFPFHIDLIQINRETKNWFNPLVNYNIGFKFIKGSKVIIQNAEVCHIGNVLNFVKDIVDDIYYVFDVNASLNYETNEEIYKYNQLTTEIYNQQLFDVWYQSASNNRNLHFLTAMTKSTFDKVKCFDYDCTMGSCHDDDDFLLKIISKNINIQNCHHTQYNIGGIHLFHVLASQVWDHGVELNNKLFESKKRIYNLNSKYISATENKEEFESNYKLLS